jgi:hypothetical protein
LRLDGYAEFILAHRFSNSKMCCAGSNLSPLRTEVRRGLREFA